jgi:hypothetical protein
MDKRMTIEEWVKSQTCCEVCKENNGGIMFMIPEDSPGCDKWHRICEKCAKSHRLIDTTRVVDE